MRIRKSGNRSICLAAICTDPRRSTTRGIQPLLSLSLPPSLDSGSGSGSRSVKEGKREAASRLKERPQSSGLENAFSVPLASLRVCLPSPSPSLAPADAVAAVLGSTHIGRRREGQQSLSLFRGDERAGDTNTCSIDESLGVHR